MTVSKPIPCSLYDIQGLQSWLDEMAREGLFLHHLSNSNDRAYFESGEPRPVRYRLDPCGKGRRKDKEREEAYAQMGWRFVTRMRRGFYIFSCDDPETPELYNDPQSLSVALEKQVDRETRSIVCLTLGLTLFLSALFYWARRNILQHLLLWDDPAYLASFILSFSLILVSLLAMALQLWARHRLIKALAQGFPPKAKRRWNRPRFLSCYIFFFVLCRLPSLFLPDFRGEVRPLSGAELSHPWPLVQTNGYVHTNRSWFAPVQEYVSSESSPDRWTGVRYINARSPELAKLLFELELEEAERVLNNWSKWNNHFYTIYGSPRLNPQSWPGVDRLETAQYTQRGQDAWTFAALRGRDVLVVNCSGFPSWEECLPLFFDVLDQSEEGSVI